MRRLLIVSPHFPPINAPDMQRIRMSLADYRQQGWEPIVLAVSPAHVSAVQEPELVATLPSDINVNWCGALPVRWSKWLGLGTIGLRCWWSLYLAGRRILAAHRCDLIFLSNTQFVTFAVARLWQQEFGVPYVFDLQDPWRTKHYRESRRRPPGGWKYRFAQAIGWALEEFSFAGAAAMMSVSPAYIVDLRRRYPWSRQLLSRTIGFGVSERDMDVARTLPSPSWREEPECVHLVYTGAAGPIMPGALEILLRALASFRQTDPNGAKRLRLHFIGTSYVAPGQGRPVVEPIASQFGVCDLVREVPHRIGHLTSLAAQLHADALLLPGSSDRAYSPSKVYPYFLTRRPMLALVYADSTLETLIERLGGAFIARIRREDEGASAISATRAFFEAASRRFDNWADPIRHDDFFRSTYLSPVLTREQTDLFTRASQTPAAKPQRVI